MYPQTLELRKLTQKNQSYSHYNFFNKKEYLSIVYIQVNPCPAEPGYILPLQTV